MHTRLAHQLTAALQTATADDTRAGEFRKIEAREPSRDLTVLQLSSSSSLSVLDAHRIIELLIQLHLLSEQKLWVCRIRNQV